MLTTPEALSESASLSSSGIVSYFYSKLGLCGVWKSADCRRKGHSMDFDTKQLGHAPDAIAPDGSEVRVLGRVGRASMAHFTLPPKAVSKAVAHHTIEEIWYFLSGYGKMWRRLGDQEEVVEVGPGLALTLPTGTHFQFRCDSPEPLTAVGATMPPWPGEGETFAVEGPWQATV